MKRKKIFVVFGTRPEAIKLAPVILEFKKNKKFLTKVCVTAQHREMLDQVLKLFSIKPDYDLNIMTKNQSLDILTAKIITKLTDIFLKDRPDLVVVQGDTTTTFTAALAAYYLKIDVAHVEAGLRSGDRFNPFPEEINRILTSAIARFHFAPTKLAKSNLIRMGIKENSIIVSGNTVIDSLLQVVEKLSYNKKDLKWYRYFLENYKLDLKNGKKNILVTGHRRESFGEGFKNICKGIKKIADKYDDIQIIYPVHLNPNVQKPVKEYLSKNTNIYLLPPMEYEPFVYLLSKSYLVLTDSGGVQEEAPSLGIPVLVMRKTTERIEGIYSGNCKLVGTDANKIFFETNKVLSSKKIYYKMSKANNPYGDGLASKRIVEFFINNY
ncbi:MAG: UDP-N-acetylglucosamine 2-epimerase (non-hydrolyzing) [Ignavibacteria bacterium]|nr:UDP-N-acetylglucosamine 2-epimerase (non-hydrolyzing) [Ignavibacteria bacterium]